ncbi:permease [Marinoscillum furvescens]|uniref:Permease n=1 Tax=Marinoscillum furvescens DSM 4134 TaxID=1122208 RepID=A0A3D9L0I3_MARFU|nr:permease [Marinoscillum furvescens]RED96954.1 hypothetical protein C7460_1132 [Marinoscillum furvescens DSM 4134]
MEHFLSQWAMAAHTTLGFFWMALWAFILGYAVSSLIQIFVTEEKMQQTMGDASARSISLGAFFGFMSSSCSFSALATTKSLFQKGASFVASIAFLLASTNLVVELGIIISIFLGWQFVVGEYVGGILLILCSWALIRIIRPHKLVEKARKQLKQPREMEDEDTALSAKLQSRTHWAKVGQQYAMEWKMVWKDVTVGFTIAGIVAAFVPDSFFEALFIHSGKSTQDYSFWELLQHIVVGPVAAFMTFIGSMGNIPLAALLFGKGVSFAGVMAFIFSDLVVFPVLRINAKYYGWKMSFFILFLLFTSLIAATLVLHYGFDWAGMLPDPTAAKSLTEKSHFQIDYTFFLNLSFLVVSGILIYLGFVKGKEVMHHKEMAPKSRVLENTLKWLALGCYLWLAGGMVVYLLR